MERLININPENVYESDPSKIETLWSNKYFITMSRNTRASRARKFERNLLAAEWTHGNVHGGKRLSKT